MSPAASVSAAGAGAWMCDLHARCVEWAQRQGQASATARTEAYVDLVGAFGLARVGDAATAGVLLGLSRSTLASLDDAHVCLLRAYEYRISQALDGRSHTG